MQSVSQAWKDNQNSTLVGESDILISLKMTDPDAYEDASATDNGSAVFADTNYIVSDGEKDVTPYATLERNLWLLDGSREVVPDSDYDKVGYVGASLSTNKGVFAVNPIVTINFSRVHLNLLQGINIKWSEFLNEYATEFTVTAHNGSIDVNTLTITDNKSVSSSVMMDISNYDSITIEVLKWSMPHHRARIDEVYVGADKVFSKKDIFSYDCSNSVDPISAELPKSEVAFSIDNLNGAYNPYNEKGLSKYLMERQEIHVMYGYKLGDSVEWISGGKYYISEWNAEQNGMSADFKARDLLEFMTGTFYKGLYSPGGISLYDLAESVLLDADLPINSDGTVKWVIDEGLKNIYTIAPLPVDTHANCLQMIANAGESVFYQDRDGVLRIERRSVGSQTVSDYAITHFNSYSKSDLSLSKPLKQVDVPCYNYSVATEKSELFNGVLNINGTTEVVITYSGAATNVVASLTGGTLNSATYYTNACVLKITATGNVTIVVKGNSLESSSVQISVMNDVSSETGESVSVDNPLITSQERAVAVGTWVKTYMSNRKLLSSDWRADPRLDALDVVNNENDYGVSKVIMTNVKYTYNGAFRGSGEGRVI